VALARDFLAESEAMIVTAKRVIKETRTRVADSRALIEKITQCLERSGRASDLSTDIEIEVLERLHEMTVRFLHKESLTTLLEEALEAAMRVTAAPLGNVQLLNPATGVLNIAVQQGFRSDFLDFFAEVPATGSACGLALRNGRRVIVRNVVGDPSFTVESRRAMLRANARAVQSTPLVGMSGNVIGIVSTHYREPRVAQTRALSIVDIYARQIGTLMESPRPVAIAV